MIHFLLSRAIAVVIVTLALGTASLAQYETEEFSEPDALSVSYVRVRIGYRKSLREGERSSFKWLSRLIKETPKETSFKVEWQTTHKGKRISVIMGYDTDVARLTRFRLFSTQPITVRSDSMSKSQQLPIYDESWGPVSVQEIHHLAKRGGTIADLKILR